jgi:nucleoside-diphosphate-sugar epimerase
MQTILGSGGAIGVELAKALPSYTDSVRLVSRNPARVNQTDHLLPADLTVKEQVIKAVEGSEVVYLTVGLTYNIKIWEHMWPLIVGNVVEACRVHGSKLVFFDNVYMYHPDEMGAMTEESNVDPVTRKGKVRARVAKTLMDVVRNGDIKALIARSADFYGPSIKDVSILTETIIKPLSEGKKAQCLGRMNVKHSFTYTPDAGKATAILGNTEDAYGQVWHLPTTADPYTMKELVTIIAAELGVKPKFMAANRFMVQIIGLFVPIMKEMVEMMYQYDRDYVFVSDKFENRFDFTPTPYKQGIKEIIKADYS